MSLLGVEVGGNYEGAAGYPIVDLAQNKTLLVDQKDVDVTEENYELAHNVIRGVCSPFFRMMRDLRHHPSDITHLSSAAVSDNLLDNSEVTLLEKLILSF